MTTELIKPAGWDSFDELLTCDAGRAYVAEQLGGSVKYEKNFKSSRTNADACSYDLFEDGSLWFHSNSQDEVWADANDFVRNMAFDYLWWTDCDGRDGLIVDDMDRDLLIHLWGEEAACEFFVSAGGVLALETEQ